MLAGDFTKVFTQAWQYAVRSGITTAMEEQRLRELLGGDYERVAAVRRVAAGAAREAGNPGELGQRRE